MHLSKSVFTIVAVALTSAFAARPMSTADAGTVSPESIEMEVAAEYGDNQLSPSVGVTHGLSDRCDLALSSSYTTYPREERGTDPLSFTFRYSLLPDHIAISATSEISDPTWSALLIASHALGNFSINGNLGFEAVGGSNEKQVLFNAMTSFAVGPVTLSAEYLGVSRSVDLLGAGVQWSIMERLAIDTGIHTDLDGNWSLTSGLWTSF